MPRGDRGKRFPTKFVGWILVTVAFLLVIIGAGYGLSQQAAYEQEAKERSADYAKYTAGQIKHACTQTASPPLEKARCIKNAVAEYRLKTRDNQREYDDLAAQRTSALWTSIMGLAAVIGMALSAIGVALVYTTFNETRLTNRIAMKEGARSTRRAMAGAAETAAAIEVAQYSAAAARDANEIARKARHDANEAAKEQAKIAARSAAAAIESVAVSQNTATTQLRPHVYLEHCGIEFQYMSTIEAMGNTADVTFYFKNFGRTPAKDVVLKADTPIGRYWSDEFGSTVEDKFHVRLGDIPQGHTKERDGYTVVGLAPVHRDIINSERSIFVEGILTYSDWGGNEYATRFRWALTGPDYWKCKFSVTPNGNEAT